MDVFASKQDGRGESYISYIQGRYRFRFTHCPEVHVTTALRDDTWLRSWDDVLTDYEAWEHAGNPDAFVWGVESAEAYPGMSYVGDSDLAASWSRRLGRTMHEAVIETNVYVLRLVFHDLKVEQLAVGDPTTGELKPVS